MFVLMVNYTLNYLFIAQFSYLGAMMQILFCKQNIINEHSISNGILDMNQIKISYTF